MGEFAIGTTLLGHAHTKRMTDLLLAQTSAFMQVVALTDSESINLIISTWLPLTVLIAMEAAKVHFLFHITVAVIVIYRWGLSQQKR